MMVDGKDPGYTLKHAACVHRDLCGQNRQDQEICAAVLLDLLPSIRSLGKTQHLPEEMKHVQGSLLQVVSGYWSVVHVVKCCFPP